eukprot:388834-Rhodomonas_salina.1
MWHALTIACVRTATEEAYAEAKRAEDMSRAEAVLGEQEHDDLYVQVRANPGTDIAYGAVCTRIEKERAELKKKGGCAPPRYATSGTDTGYCYARSPTLVPHSSSACQYRYWAVCYAMCGTDVGGAATRLTPVTFDNFVAWKKRKVASLRRVWY